MTNIKEKILSSINTDKERKLGAFALQDEYLKLFEKMAPISNKLKDFKNSPQDFFENFDFEIYNKDYYYKNIDLQQIIDKIPADANIIFILNGYFSEEKSIIKSKGLNVKSLLELLQDEYFEVKKYFLEYSEIHENQLTVLNSMLANDCLYVNILDNTEVDAPIFILNVYTENDNPYLFNARKIINIGENASAQLIEADITYIDGKFLAVDISLINSKQNSKLDYMKLNFDVTKSSINPTNNNISNANHIKADSFHLAKKAVLNYHTIRLDAIYERNRGHFILEGNNSEVNISSFNLLKNARTADLRTLVVHESPETICNQLTKVIVDDNSHFAFDGKIIVKKSAQKTDAKQNSRAILLNDNAQVTFNPQLEIYADDVQCSHGSAIGHLDNELMFYLNSRGIGTEEAEKLLLSAFATEIVENTNFPIFLKNYITDNINKRI